MTDTNTEDTKLENTQEPNAEELALRAEAAEMGWVDKDEFRGDPKGWVDAKTFVDKGKHVMPILHNNNERLKAELRVRDQKIRQQDAALAELRDSVEALGEFHREDTKRKVEEERDRIKAELKAAKRDGNVDAEVELTSDLAQLDAKAGTGGEDESQKRRKDDRVAPRKGNGQDDGEVPEDLRQWARENTWYGKDPTRTDLANGIAQRLRANGDSLIGRPFMDKVSTELDATMKRLGINTRTSRVEANRGGADNRTSLGKTFADLPAEAQAACHKFTNRLVGANKLHKTQAEWESAYTKKYLEDNS